jgi:hypothetical protein
MIVSKPRKSVSESRFGQLANRVLTELFNGDREKMGLACRINPVSVHRWVTDEGISPNTSSLSALRELLGLSELTLEQYLAGKLELSQLWELRLRRDYSTVHEVEWILRWARTLDTKAQLDIGAVLVAECAQAFSQNPDIWRQSQGGSIRISPTQSGLLVRLIGMSLMYSRTGGGIAEFFQGIGLSKETEDQLLSGVETHLPRSVINQIAAGVLRPIHWNVGNSLAMPELSGSALYRSGDELLSDLENWEQACQYPASVN